MSHFVCVVFSHDGNVERQMAPYCENNEDCYRPHIIVPESKVLKKYLMSLSYAKKEVPQLNDEELKKEAIKWAKENYEQFPSGDYGYFCNPNAKWDYYDEDTYDPRAVNEEYKNSLYSEITDIEDIRLKNINKKFIPWAFVTPDGAWHEPGTCGWFGMSDETPESMEEFKNEYKTFIQDAANQNLLMKILDCHI